mgnify:FL=1
MMSEEDTLLLHLIRATAIDGGGVPDEVLLREARAHIRTFTQACNCGRQNLYQKGDDKPSLKYGNDYMARSRAALSGEGYAYTHHHLLQIMAVFYVLLRRPRMRTQYSRHLWYIDTLCQLIDDNLLNNCRETIFPYRNQIKALADRIDRINQPDLFYGECLSPLPFTPKPQKPTNMGDTYNIQMNSGCGDFIANGGTKNITNHYPQQSAQQKEGTLFAYIDLTACTPREAQQAEETLRSVAHKSPKEIAGAVHDLERACLLRKADKIAGFVREFNNHFGTNLNEQSFYSAYRNT